MSLTLGILAVILLAILVQRRIHASDDRIWVSAARTLEFAAVAWSVCVTLYLIFVPTHDGISAEGLHSAAVEKVTKSSRTVLQAEGVLALVPLLAPVLLTLLPWLSPNPRTRRHLLVVGTLLLLLFAVLGALSVGLFYLPGALAMVTAAAIELSTSGTRCVGRRVDSSHSPGKPE